MIIFRCKRLSGLGLMKGLTEPARSCWEGFVGFDSRSNSATLSSSVLCDAVPPICRLKEPAAFPLCSTSGLSGDSGS